MNNEIICGDSLEVLKTLESESVDCCITSPPYFGLRDYGVSGQIGLEETPEAFVAALVAVFREVKRVLKKEGTLWLNLGDSYSSNGKMGGDIDLDTGMDVQRGRGRMKKHDTIKPKDLVGIPWMVAFALRKDGWYLRQDIIWHKPNPMPESVTDRCTKAHEYIFLMSKSQKYYFDNEAIAEDAIEGKDLGLLRGRQSTGESTKVAWHAPSIKARQDAGIDSRCAGTGKRNKRSVWTVTTKPYKGAHFATFPEALIEPMILAGCPEAGVVLDPFMGAGTTAVVAQKLGRNWLGIELNPEYIRIATERISGSPIPLFTK